MGYRRKSILKPFIILPFLIYLLFISLDTTDFAYANANPKAVLSKSNRLDTLNNLFFKYSENFVFIKSLDNVEKVFRDGTIYIANSRARLDLLIHFKEAKFEKNYWLAKGVEIKKIKYNGITPKGYDVFYKESLPILEGYYPKVIKLLYEGKRLSIYDGFVL